MSRVSGCDWYLVSTTRTHTEHHILHPLDMVDFVPLVHVFSHIFQTMHDPSRISQRSRTDPTLVARSSSAPAHTRAARETRAVRRDRETVAAQTPWYVSRFGDASRLPLPARTLRDARGGVRRSQRPPSVALFLSATASARSKRRSMRIGARSRHDLCSADDARAGRRVRASGTRLDARDAFRTLPLTRAFSLAPPISPFAVRDRRSSSLASSSPSSSPNSRPST